MLPEQPDKASRGPAHSLVKALRSVPDLASLDDSTLLRIVGASANLAFAKEATVFEAGAPSEALYVVLSGRVSIFDVGAAGEQEVAVLGPGESFGEISLLLRTKHTKSARALEPTELMIVPHEYFDEVLATNPDLRTVFERRMEQRRTVRGDVSESR